MIKIKVKELLEKNNMTQRELADITKIRPNTISAYYHETMQRIDVDHLDSLCKVFNLKDINDLIEYIPHNSNIINQFTPISALSNVVNTLLSNKNLTQSIIDDSQDFLHNLFLQVINNPNLKEDDDFIIFGAMFIKVVTNNLLSEERLDIIMNMLRDNHYPHITDRR